MSGLQEAAVAIVLVLTPQPAPDPAVERFAASVFEPIVIAGLCRDRVGDEMYSTVRAVTSNIIGEPAVVELESAMATSVDAEADYSLDDCLDALLASMRQARDAADDMARRDALD